MILFSELLAPVPTAQVIGNPPQHIAQLCSDSRQAQAGSLFFAIKGSHTDGHQFVPKALAQGAAAVVCQELNPEWLAAYPNACFIQLKDSSLAMGLMASRFYSDPSTQMQVVGCTGTNGKTTTSSLLYQLFTRMGYLCGLISTVEYKIGGRSFPSTHTTPDALILQKLLYDMQQAGCSYVFMEVSSHAAHQQRIAGLRFAGAIFTNLSHDHLDYHGTFQNYIQAKKLFFDGLHKEAFALVNIDDKRGEIMLQNCRAQAHRYALKTPADFKAKVLDNSLNGLHLDLDGADFHSPLIGDFNAYNLLAVYAAARLLKADKTEVLAHLSALTTVSGRFDIVKHPAKAGVIGIVDYAHTPDALEKVLQTVNRIVPQDKIICIVGCGGDRDKTKRPVMAKIAYDYSGLALLTSDNPRTEQPLDILNDMQRGLLGLDNSRYMIVSDRKQAIAHAAQIAQAGTVILLAGKGHETYQEINGQRFDFDDKKILFEALGSAATNL